MSLTLGGTTVEVLERPPHGTFYRRLWIPGRGKSWASLKTRERTEAQRRATAFLHAYVADSMPVVYPDPLTLKTLWRRYSEEAPAYRANTKRTREDKEARAELLLAGLGAEKVVALLCTHDVERYTEIRRHGAGWPDGRETAAVRARSVAADLQLLRTMLRWATTVRQPDGSWLLAENPLRGLVLPREVAPRRPLASFDRFLAVRDTLSRLIEEAETNAKAAEKEKDQRRFQRDAAKWRRLDLALVLAESTGRRIGSIRALRWEDVLTEPARIRWAAEFDKRRREAIVPIPDTLAQTLREFRAQLRAWGDGWIFPKRDGSAPWATAYLAELLRAAERKAEVPPLHGGLWHPYRRKWATERKHLPLVDVQAAGGWKDTKTLLSCYQHASEEGMLAVLSAPQKLRESRA